MSEYSNMVTILGYVQGILYLLSSIMKLVKFQKGSNGMFQGKTAFMPMFFFPIAIASEWLSFYLFFLRKDYELAVLNSSIYVGGIFFIVFREGSKAPLAPAIIMSTLLAITLFLISNTTRAKSFGLPTTAFIALGFGHICGRLLPYLK